ncbi:hypothetical protein ACTA71_012329, partial [Dictyostelium dimigraforme]
VIAET